MTDDTPGPCGARTWTPGHTTHVFHRCVLYRGHPSDHRCGCLLWFPNRRKVPDKERPW